MSKASQKKNKESTKSRNWLSCHAKGLTGRKGAGFHVDKKKKAIKLQCRGKVDYEKSNY
jgi:hypothetical protein